MKYALFALAALILAGVYLLLLSDSRTATNVPSNGTTIIAFGDSLVAGVGASEGNDFISNLSDRIGEPIINLGQSGNTTRDGMARIDTVLANDPKVVVLLLGGNDYLQKIPTEETFANLEQMIKLIHESGSAVLLLGVRGGILRDNFKRNYARVAKKHNTGFVSDVLSGILGRSELMADSIHPNDDGYRLMAERIQPELARLLK